QRRGFGEAVDPIAELGHELDEVAHTAAFEHGSLRDAQRLAHDLDPRPECGRAPGFPAAPPEHAEPRVVRVARDLLDESALADARNAAQEPQPATSAACRRDRLTQHRLLGGPSD